MGFNLSVSIVIVGWNLWVFAQALRLHSLCRNTTSLWILKRKLPVGIYQLTCRNFCYLWFWGIRWLSASPQSLHVTTSDQNALHHIASRFPFLWLDDLLSCQFVAPHAKLLQVPEIIHLINHVKCHKSQPYLRNM